VRAMIFKGKYINTIGSVDAYTVHKRGQVVIYSTNKPPKSVDTNIHKVAIVDDTGVVYIKNGVMKS